MKKASLPTILFTVFIDLLGFGILIPVIPLLLADPHSKYYLLTPGSPLSTGYFILGLILTIYPLAQFFSAPILGQLSDRYGRKPILAISLFGTAISYLLFALGIYYHHIPLLFIGRLLDGITGGNISVAQAAVADITPPEKRAKNFGLIGLVFGLGFILGPFLGGKLSDPKILPFFDLTTPFWFAFLLALTNSLLVIFRLPETLAVKKHNLKIRLGRSLQDIIKAVNRGSMRVLFSTSFLVQAGFSFFTTFFGVFLIKKFSYTQGQIGDLFAYIGLWIAFTQGFITRKLSVIEESKILKIVLFGNALAIILFFIPANHLWLYLIIPFFAIQNGLLNANLLGLISRSAPNQDQGEVLGINASVQALGQAIPPLISGVIAAKLNPSAPTLVSSGVLFVAALIFTKYYRPKSAL